MLWRGEEGTHSSPFVWLPLESLPVVASAKHMGDTYLLACLGLERGPHIGLFVTSWALFLTHETRDHSHSLLFRVFALGLGFYGLGL